jgi:hypothetical protein
MSFVLMILMELLTITVKTFFCFDDIDGIVDHHGQQFHQYHQNKRKFKQ